METIKLNYQDILVCDPGYIKNVSCTYGDTKEKRFDALKLIEVLHEGDDGEYEIETADGAKFLGVDSGRIWKLMAEFDCEVLIDSGLSGYIVARKGSAIWGGDIKLYEGSL